MSDAKKKAHPTGNSKPAAPTGAHPAASPNSSSKPQKPAATQPPQKVKTDKVDGKVPSKPGSRPISSQKVKTDTIEGKVPSKPASRPLSGASTGAKLSSSRPTSSKPSQRSNSAPPTQPSFDISSRTQTTIGIQQLPAILDALYAQNKYTPLIIDPNGRADVFFVNGGYEALIIDVKKLMVQVEIQKTLSLEEAKEEIRRTLVSGLKNGKTIVFAMTNSAFAYHKYIDPEFFPECVRERGGSTFRTDPALYTPCLRPEDTTHGIFIPNETWPFRVVITSNFEEEDYEEFLQPSLKLNDMFPIVIKA